MKKLLCIFLTGVMLFSFFACGNTGYWEDNTENGELELKAASEMVDSINENMVKPQLSLENNYEFIIAGTAMFTDILEYESEDIKRIAIDEVDDYGRAIVYIKRKSDSMYGTGVYYENENGQLRYYVDYYICIQNVDFEKETYSIDTLLCMTNDKTKKDFLKAMNGFGLDTPSATAQEFPLHDTRITEAREEAEMAASKLYLKDEPRYSESVDALDKTFNVYTAKGEYLTVDMYTLQGVEKVYSMSISISNSILNRFSKNIRAAFYETLANCLSDWMPNADKAELENLVSKYSDYIGEPQFFDGGHIVHITRQNGEVIFTVTDGNSLGYTKDSYWTPVQAFAEEEEQNTEPPETKPELETELLPPAEDERYLYNEIPETSSPKTEAVETVSVLLIEGIYYVHVGAFRDQNNATNRINELIGKGFPATSQMVNGLNKVYVGPFTTRSEADTALADLKNAGYDSYISTSL